MDDKAKLIEELLERTTEYGKTSYELIKFKALDKTTDVVSSIVPHSLVFILILTFMGFANLGLAYWLGEILSKTYYGFFVVAGFYGVLGIIIHFFMHKRLKRKIGNYIIKHTLN